MLSPEIGAYESKEPRIKHCESKLIHSLRNKPRTQPATIKTAFCQQQQHWKHTHMHAHMRTHTMTVAETVSV